MANKVEIQVNAKSQNAEKSLERVKGKMGGLSNAGNTATRAFGGLNKGLAMVGVASIGSAVSLGAIQGAIKNVRIQAASTTIRLRQFGTDAEKAFDEQRDALVESAKAYGFTGTEALKAYTIIASKSNTGVASVTDLKTAMGMARAEGIGLTEASNMIGDAIGGNIIPLQNFMHRIADINVLFKDFREEGLGAVTSLDKLTARVKTGWESATIAVGDFGTEMGAITSAMLELFPSPTELTTLVNKFIKNIGQSLVAAAPALVDLITEWGGHLKDWMLSWIPSWDDIKQKAIELWGMGAAVGNKAWDLLTGASGVVGAAVDKGEGFTDWDSLNEKLEDTLGNGDAGAAGEGGDSVDSDEDAKKAASDAEGIVKELAAAMQTRTAREMLAGSNVTTETLIKIIDKTKNGITVEEDTLQLSEDAFENTERLEGAGHNKAGSTAFGVVPMTEH